VKLHNYKILKNIFLNRLKSCLECVLHNRRIADAAEIVESLPEGTNGVGQAKIRHGRMEEKDGVELAKNRLGRLEMDDETHTKNHQCLFPIFVAM
jgi:hypothetical protein